MIQELDLFLEKHYRPRKSKEVVLRNKRTRPIFDSEIQILNCCKNIPIEKTSKTFSEMVISYIDEKGFKDADVYKRAGVSKQVFSNLRTNRDYEPKRNTAFSLALALQLDLNEATKLLTAAGMRFSSASKFDLIIKYFFSEKQYDMKYINETLYEYTGKCLLD